jgi:hypothetical protein
VIHFLMEEEEEEYGNDHVSAAAATDNDADVAIIMMPWSAWRWQTAKDRLSRLAESVDPTAREELQVLSFAASDAYQVTWCCIQKLCINSGEPQ